MSYIDIVFDGPPAPEAGRFVEVENDSGFSINVGEWIERADGYWALRISKAVGADEVGEQVRSDGAAGTSEPSSCTREEIRREAFEEVREALMDMAAHLTAATSAYERFAKRHSSQGKAETDALFSTRLGDFKAATDRARAFTQRFIASPPPTSGEREE